MVKERQKIRQGRVIGTKMDKTIIVSVIWSLPHPLYAKPVRRVTKFYAHDQENRCQVGDLVRIQETRPISRLKRWRLIDILESHEQVDVKPADLGQTELAEVTGPAVETSITNEVEETTTPEGEPVQDYASDSDEEPTVEMTDQEAAD